MPMKYKKDKNYTIAIRVTESDLEKIDAMAADEKRTRSEIVRMFIQGGVNNGKESKKVAI